MLYERIQKYIKEERYHEALGLALSYSERVDDKNDEDLDKYQIIAEEILEKIIELDSSDYSNDINPRSEIIENLKRKTRKRLFNEENIFLEK